MKKLLILCSLLCACTSVFAANHADQTTFTLGAAYYHFAPKRNINNAVMPNAAIGYNFNDRWAAEFEVGNINTNQNNGPSEHAVLFLLDGIYRFTPKQYFQPYVIAGVGVMNLKPPVGNSNQYQNNVNAGIGTQFFADKSIAFKGEVRDLYTLSGGYNDYMINFGISYLMG